MPMPVAWLKVLKRTFAHFVVRSRKRRHERESNTAVTEGECKTVKSFSIRAKALLRDLSVKSFAGF